MPSLRTLHLANFARGEVDLRRLAALLRLETLDLTGVEIDEADAQALSGFLSLRHLYVETPFDPEAAAAVLRPLQAAPVLEEIFLIVPPDIYEGVVAAVQPGLPGVRIRPAIVERTLFPAWLGAFGAAGVFAMLGLQLVLWTSGSLPAAVPGFTAAHRRVGWALTGLCVLAVTLSAWASGLPPLAVAPGVAAFFAALWWMQLSGRAAADATSFTPGFDATARWLPLIPMACLAVTLIASASLPPGRRAAATAVTLTLAAVFFCVLADRWLRGRKRRPPRRGLEGAASGWTAAEGLDKLAAGEGWPLHPDRSRVPERVLASVAIGGAACGLVLFTDLPRIDPQTLAIVAPGVGINLLLQPLIWTESRWRRRLDHLRCGVTLPGGRRRQVQTTFDAMASDYAGLWPLVVAMAASVGVAANRIDFGLSPADCTLIASAFGVLAVGVAHMVGVLLWRHRILSVLILAVAMGLGWAGNIVFLVDDGISTGWAFVPAAGAVFLAFAANRHARRRELKRIWG